MPAPQRINLHKYYHYPINKEYISEFLNQKGFHKHARNHRLLMNWHSQRSRVMTVPMVKYRNTEVKLNDKRINPQRSLIGVMRIKVRPGMNKMSVQYQPGRIFKIMSIIAVVSWGVIIFWYFKLKTDSD